MMSTLNQGDLRWRPEVHHEAGADLSIRFTGQRKTDGG